MRGGAYCACLTWASGANEATYVLAGRAAYDVYFCASSGVFVKIKTHCASAGWLALLGGRGAPATNTATGTGAAVTDTGAIWAEPGR